MEKKQRPTLAERIVDNFRKAEEKTARHTIIDLRPFIGKKRGKLS